MITAVFDCMVFLQAVTSDGPSFTCLTFVESNHVLLHISPKILAEIRDVLGRPKIQARFTSLTPNRIDLFLAKLAAMSSLQVNDPADAGVELRDPDDSVYLNLAIEAKANFLVSRDKDLLDLMNASDFVVRFPNLRVLGPVEFLNLVKKANPGLQ